MFVSKPEVFVSEGSTICQIDGIILLVMREKIVLNKSINEDKNNYLFLFRHQMRQVVFLSSLADSI